MQRGRGDPQQPPERAATSRRWEAKAAAGVEVQWIPLFVLDSAIEEEVNFWEIYLKE